MAEAAIVEAKVETQVRQAEHELGEYGVEREDTGSEITEPYDPSKIRVSRQQPTIYSLIQRIEHEELDLFPDFQRHANLWRDRTQSRLIESVLMAIPLPAFYFDATDPDQWLVVDGLQRLTAISRFRLGDEQLKRIDLSPLHLQDLEYLKELEGQRFHELPRRHQRQIEETQLTAYVIEEGTPEELKFNIFKRINTGGLPLSPQEIRHALNRGEARELLTRLASSGEFQAATGEGISGKRMADRECVLRFMAFALAPPEEYQQGDFDLFLNKQMNRINELGREERENISRRFIRSMATARRLFDNNAFRKRYTLNASRLPINKALFEAWSVNLDRLGDNAVEILYDKRRALIDRFIHLMNNDRDFERAISQGTGDVKKVHLRFSTIRRLIEETIECPP